MLALPTVAGAAHGAPAGAGLPRAFAGWPAGASPQEIGRRVAGLGRRLVVIQEGGYDVASLGGSVANWLSGALSAAHALARPAAARVRLQGVKSDLRRHS